MGSKYDHTLCWDCAKATSPECPWAESGKPVEGWRAKKTKLRFSGEESDSYRVFSCPLFERDAVKGGMKKVGGENDKGVCRGGKHSATDAVYRMALIANSGNLGSGDSALADCGDRQTRILNENRDVIDLAYGVLERAVMDWKLLEYGRKEAAMVERGEWVKRDDMVEFFFSRWFHRLCEPLHYSPEEIRAALGIPESARWTKAKS